MQDVFITVMLLASLSAVLFVIGYGGWPRQREREQSDELGRADRP